MFKRYGRIKFFSKKEETLMLLEKINTLEERITHYATYHSRLLSDCRGRDEATLKYLAGKYNCQFNSYYCPLKEEWVVEEKEINN